MDQIKNSKEEEILEKEEKILEKIIKENLFNPSLKTYKLFKKD
jgi:chorismate mutase